MSESTPDGTETPRSHLQAVPAEASTEKPAAPAPARQGGGHMTGLLALLLAVAVFAFLAQFSETRKLQAENEGLRAELTSARAELEASRAQMGEARDALGGLRDVLARIEGLLTPPAPAPAAEAAAPEPAAAR